MNREIAETILSQIKQLDGWALAAWGAKELVNLGDGLQFKTSGMTPWKGYVQIRLNGLDYYDLSFVKVRKGIPKTMKEIKDVVAFDLVESIDEFVG